MNKILDKSWPILRLPDVVKEIMYARWNYPSIPFSWPLQTNQSLRFECRATKLQMPQRVKRAPDVSISFGLMFTDLPRAVKGQAEDTKLTSSGIREQGCGSCRRNWASIHRRAPDRSFVDSSRTCIRKYYPASPQVQFCPSTRFLSLLGLQDLTFDNFT